MRVGLYRNKANAELVVTMPWFGSGQFRSLGCIYEAEARDPLFGTTVYLVTDESMTEAGYEFISGETGGASE